MLLKCCTQYVSKFGKLSNGHMTGKGQSSSQFPRRAVLKNVQTTEQLHSFPMLIRLCSKSSKVGFSIMWTENFQMFKLVLEKGEEPEIKLPTSAGSLKKWESSRKASLSALLTMPKPLTVWIITNCESESQVAQSYPTLCDPMDCSLSGFSVHGILHGKNTGVGCHFLLQGNQIKSPSPIPINPSLIPTSTDDAHCSVLSWWITCLF